MIKITLLSAEFAGVTRTFDGILCREKNSEQDPTELLISLVASEISWSTDYSYATDQEKFQWFLAELVACIIRALRQGRPVHFMGQVFLPRSNQPEEIVRVASEVEEAISTSGKLVSIGMDNTFGLWISTEGYEN